MLLQWTINIDFSPSAWLARSCGTFLLPVRSKWQNDSGLGVVMSTSCEDSIDSRSTKKEPTCGIRFGVVVLITAHNNAGGFGGGGNVIIRFSRHRDEIQAAHFGSGEVDDHSRKTFAVRVRDKRGPMGIPQRVIWLRKERIRSGRIFGSVRRKPDGKCAFRKAEEAALAPRGMYQKP